MVFLLIGAADSINRSWKDCKDKKHKPPATYSLGFYSVGLSQFILDSELVFVYPFIYSIYNSGTVIFNAFLAFLLLLSLMFVYELGNEVLLF